MSREHEHEHDGISCEEVIEQLFVYLDGEIDTDKRAVIDRHLERCRDCFTRAEFERRLRRKIAESTSVQAPESLRRRIHSLLDEF